MRQTDRWYELWPTFAGPSLFTLCVTVGTPASFRSQHWVKDSWILFGLFLKMFLFFSSIIAQLFLSNYFWPFFHVSAQSVTSSPLSLQSSPRLRPWHALRWFRTDPEICSGHKTINIHLWIHVCNSKMIFLHWWIGYYNQLILGGCQDALQNV